MNLEELFEDDGNLVDSEGRLVDVESVGAPIIAFWGEKPWKLETYCKRAPPDADFFVRGEMTSVRKRRENKGMNYWPPLAPIYDTLFFEAVQYYKKKD